MPKSWLERGKGALKKWLSTTEPVQEEETQTDMGVYTNSTGGLVLTSGGGVSSAASGAAPWYLEDYTDGEITLTWRNMTDTGDGPSGGGTLNSDGQFKVTSAAGVLSGLTDDLYTTFGQIFGAVAGAAASTDKCTVNFPVGNFLGNDTTFSQDIKLKLKGTLVGIAHPWKASGYTQYTRLRSSAAVFTVNSSSTDNILFLEDMALHDESTGAATWGTRHITGGAFYTYNVTHENRSDNFQSTNRTGKRSLGQARFRNSVFRYGDDAGSGKRHHIYAHDLNYLEIVNCAFYDPAVGAHCIKAYSEQTYIDGNLIVNKLDDSNHSSNANWGGQPIDFASSQDVICTNNTIVAVTRDLWTSAPAITAMSKSRRRGEYWGARSLKVPQYFENEPDYSNGGFEPYWEDGASGWETLGTTDYAKGEWRGRSAALAAEGTAYSFVSVVLAESQTASIPDSSPYNTSSYWRLEVELDDGTVHSTTATRAGNTSLTLDTAVPSGKAIDLQAPAMMYPDSRGQRLRQLKEEYHNPNHVDYPWPNIQAASLGDLTYRHAHFFQNNHFVLRTEQSGNVELHHHQGCAPIHRAGTGEDSNNDLALGPQWYSGCGWSDPSSGGESVGVFDESVAQRNSRRMGSAPSGYGGLSGSDYSEPCYVFFGNNALTIEGNPSGTGSWATEPYEEDQTIQQGTVSYSSPIYEIDNAGSVTRQTSGPTHKTMVQTTTSGAASADQADIAVTSATGLSTGQQIYVVCENDPWDLSTGQWSHITTIAAIDGTTITLTDNLPYSVASGATVTAHALTSLPSYWATGPSAFVNMKAGTVL